MIILENVTKISKVAGKKKLVLSSTNLAIPSDRRIALLGPSEQDKRILIETLAGTVLVTTGRVVRKAKVSFPVGDLPGFEPTVPLRVNIAYVARLYGIESPRIIRFVEKAMNMSEYFDKPYNQFPLGARRPLAQIVGLSLPFDAYLMGEDKMRGEDSLREKSWALFESRSQTCGIIVPTNDQNFARKYCDMALVLDGGRLTLHDTVAEGFELVGQSGGTDA